MVTKNEMIEAIKMSYRSSPEYLFKKSPGFCIFRHERGRKWFCAVMTIPQNKLYGESEEEINVINLKIDPNLGDILKTSPAIYPAYHMNKQHWITVDLSQIDHFEQVAGLIEDSYLLTAK